MDIQALHRDVITAIELIESGRVNMGLKVMRDMQIQVEWEILHRQLNDPDTKNNQSVA